MTAATTRQPTRRRFTVGEYHRLAEAGVLQANDKVELINGEILQMSPTGSNHSGIINHLVRHFGKLGELAVLSVQNPIRIEDHGEPEPDIALLKPRIDLYKGSTPEPKDVLLLIEVADTTLAFDLNVKRSYYATYGIHELWIVDVVREVIHVCHAPSRDTYQKVTEVKGNDELAPQAFPDFKASVHGMIG